MLGLPGVFLALLVAVFWVLVLAALASIAIELKKIRILLEWAHGSPLAVPPPPTAADE